MGDTETAKRILVIDDEPTLRDLMQVMLENEGYQVSLAESGEAGLQAMRAERPDLVLLDLKMPGMDGWSVIEQLKGFRAPPPVIAMSGMGVPEPMRWAQVGPYVCGYLPKPFDHNDLLRICERALGIEASRVADAKAYADRRKEARRDLLLQATLLSGTGTPLLLGGILNLSAAGARFELGLNLTPGTDVKLSFAIPGDPAPFVVGARTRWAKDSKLGLSFTNLSAQEQLRLGQLLGLDE